MKLVFIKIDKPEETKPEGSAAQAPECPADEKQIMEVLLLYYVDSSNNPTITRNS